MRIPAVTPFLRAAFSLRRRSSSAFSSSSDMGSPELLPCSPDEAQRNPGFLLQSQSRISLRSIRATKLRYAIETPPRGPPTPAAARACAGCEDLEAAVDRDAPVAS